MNKNSVHDCHIIPLNKIDTAMGSTIQVNGNKELPFPIKRIYYMYGIPEGETRGNHAHEDLYQLIVATSGSFEILLDDGINKKSVRLNKPNYGLLVVPGIWRDLFDFSSGAVCLVLASLTYEDNVVIRDYEAFKKFKGKEDKIG